MLCYYGKALTDALYDYQHRQHKDVLYDPNEFVAMLNNYNSNLKSFFDAIVEMTNPKGKSNETNEVNQYKVVGICYELARMRNKFVNLMKVNIKNGLLVFLIL